MGTQQCIGKKEKDKKVLEQWKQLDSKRKSTDTVDIPDSVKTENRQKREQAKLQNLEPDDGETFKQL